MVYYLSQWILESSQGTTWEDQVSFLRLFGYITLRSAGAAVTALFLSLYMGPKVIAWLRLRFGQHYIDEASKAGGMDTRHIKLGTPTMGGILMVPIIDLTALLWAQWNTLLQVTLLSMLVLAGLGFYDDYAKITRQSSEGATARLKLIIQTVLAAFIAVYLWQVPATSTLISEVLVPFVKYPVATGTIGVMLGLGLTVVTIVGSSNAVNLTDGLDGLAIGCTLIVSFVFLVFTYVASHAQIAEYLQVPHVTGAGELAVFCSAMIGAGLGFLWFNCHPAQVFMGDTGSLALGGTLGIIAVLIHQPLVLVLAGGVFVAEAGSVMVQRGWFKFTKRKYGTGRRVFRMAPLHHHFEQLGWQESQVVTRFYILCILCGIVALTTLKIR